MPIDMETFRKADAENQIKGFLHENPSRFTDIVENVEVSKSTVSKYLKQFREIDLVKKRDDNKYELLSDLTGDEERILEAIVEHGCGDEEELSQVLELSVNLRTKLKKLAELGYLGGSPEAFAIEDKTLSLLNRTITGEELDNQLVAHTTKGDGFSSYEVSFDPILNSPKDFLSFFPEVESDVEICEHCGLPLNPDYIRKITYTDPENPEEDPKEEVKEETEQLIKQLYGPVGSIYQMFRTYYSEGEGVTEKHYTTYKKDGQSYHPHCRKVIEQL
ncbi:winged helix-turn-helix domain-containing protein [Candidatus Nanohalobium constans]|uniref:HTH arsR-type domain-containing protein n=1 Tax=Candidatus Nanohalobium constans TaxID=2565781 RepID=A0A5Q0UGZ5_9ARCH|nr:winged helix-turn-helix domain-containing protein [Candidatus Nanohalobium constans]QGA80887.1 hypothetical protein LC1Nh_1011 [Candidatus Nanohalobium constans]